MPKRNLREQLQVQKYDTVNISDFSDLLEPLKPVDTNNKKVVMLPIGKLVEYKDENFEKITGRPQPFRTYNQEQLESLAKSIKSNGVIVPISVRPFENDKYQILAGRHRTRASVICGLEYVPAIIENNINDVEAALIMLDTNLEQRPQLLYSEKAFGYKMRKDLLSKQGKRNDLHEEERQDILSEIGKSNKDSRRKVSYLIRLTFLIPEILQLVDEYKIGFMLGVNMSYLSSETQIYLYQQIIVPKIKIKKEQINELITLEKYNNLTQQNIQQIFQSNHKTTLPSFTINGKYLQGYEDILSDKKEIQRLFLEFLESYKRSKGA